MKQVIATRLGFFDGARRRAGESFFVPKSVTADWFELDKAAAAEDKAASKSDGKAKATVDKAKTDAKAVEG